MDRGPGGYENRKATDGAQTAGLYRGLSAKHLLHWVKFIGSFTFNFMRNSCIGIILFLVVVQISAWAASAPYAIIQRDANSRVWVRTNVEITSAGVTVTNVHKYTELATGMHYTNSAGQWIESKEQIDILPQGGGAATQGQHQVYFPADIYDGYLDLVTSD